MLAAALAACGGAGPGSDGSEVHDEDGPAASTTPTEGVYGQAPPAIGGVPSVITMTPAGGGAVEVTHEGHDDPVMDQFGLTFSPTRLLVGLDAPVVFRNSEAALSHNVHVRSLADDATIFDDDASSGDELAVSLPAEGGYDVLCDVHPGMMAFIFGTDAPWAAFADEDGAFVIGVVPPGEYSLRLWTVDRGFHPPVSITVAEGRTGLDLRPTG